jgi:hypothetical protein
MDMAFSAVVERHRVLKPCWRRDKSATTQRAVCGMLWRFVFGAAFACRGYPAIVDALRMTSNPLGRGFRLET